MSIVSKIYNKFFRRPFYMIRLGKFGQKFRVGYDFEISPIVSFKFGYNFYSGPECRFTSNSESIVRIGDNVMFGPRCMVIGGNHNIIWDKGPMCLAPARRMARGIIVEDDVWIGAGAILLDGATIGEGSVVGAGAVVRGRAPPYSVCIGNPAYPVRQRFDRQGLANILIAKQSRYSVDDVMAEYNSLTTKSG